MPQSTRRRSAASKKYGAQLVICKDMYQVNMWQITRENRRHRRGPRHAKAVSAHPRHPVLGAEAIQRHALGTGDALQNSKETQRKKSANLATE